MSENDLIFRPGQRVRHMLGTKIMVLIDYEIITGMGIIRLGQRNTPPAPRVYSGKAWCSWVDEKNMPQKHLFDQKELILINDDMIPDILKPDTISVESKLTGVISEKFKASVQSHKISITPADNINIEHNDLIHRYLSNGSIETYVVIDAHFEEAFLPHFESSYSVDVRKKGLLETEKEQKGNTYNVNITGPNARFNNNSSDNSQNIIKINREIDSKIEDLKKEIQNLQIPEAEKAEAFELVQGLKEELNSEKPRAGMIKTIVSGLPKASNIASILNFIMNLSKTAYEISIDPNNFL